MEKFLYTNKDYVSEAAAYLYATINSFLVEQEVLNMAISGGSTPLPIYELLFKKDIDWERVNVFLVDERCVFSESENSNYGNIVRTTDKKINLFQLYFSDRGNEGSAKQYVQLLEQKLPLKNGAPEFDLILLGMGEDGHTASLFPNSFALDEMEKWVTYNKVENEFQDRITLTYPVLLNAKKIVVLIKGEKKKKIISDINNNGTERYPMTKIVKGSRYLQWILD